MLINGQQPTSDILVNGGTLGGVGTVGVINATSGTVSPGEGGGVLNSLSTTLSPSATYRVELDGNDPGVGGYDQLNVTGTVILASAVLNVTLGFPGGLEKQYTILNNDGVDPIIGTFFGLPEGEFFGASGGPFATLGAFFTITYAGGDGNDIVITQLTPRGVTDPSSTYVTAVYWELLNRTPDASGLAYWSDLLNIGRLNRNEVARGVYLSTEHLGALVDGYYRTYLGREADAEGKAGWIQLLQTELSEERVIAAFLSSDEYLQLHPTAEDYVDSLYLNVFGTPAQEPGRSSWIEIYNTQVLRLWRTDS